MNRLLSSFERISWLVDQAVSQNFVIIARISGPLTDSILKKALNILQAKHPPFRVRIKSGQAPEFVTEGVPPIPIHTIVRENDDQWINESEKEMEDPFLWEKGPFVRVTQIASQGKCDLLVTFCHIVTDATSGLKFVNNLLRLADKLSRGDADVNEISLPALPSAHDLIRKDLKYPNELLDISSRIKRFFHNPVELPGEEDVHAEKRITRIIHKILTPIETEKLALSCKKERTSVHGVICAALMQTVVEQIRSKNRVNVHKKGALMIGCLSPVNIRHLLSQHVDEDIGNFISGSFHYQLVDDHSSVWVAARKVVKTIQKDIKYGRDIKAVLNIGQLNPNLTPIEVLRSEEPLVPPVVVSNMGRLDIPEQFGDIKLEEMHFSLSINPAAKSGVGIAVTTFCGRMTLNFLYAEPYISRVRADVIAENTMKRLKDAIG